MRNESGNQPVAKLMHWSLERNILSTKLWMLVLFAIRLTTNSYIYIELPLFYFPFKLNGFINFHAIFYRQEIN